MPKDPYSFTTPIYYVNAAPHLGTAYTTIAADTMARFQRMNGKSVAFVTGLDEHGQKVAETAERNNMSPQEWCDHLEPAFRNAWDMLDITYTDFVRTTEKRQEKSVQKFWGDLYQRGYLYKSAYEGWYCVHEETYYAESDLLKNDAGEFICPECSRPVRRAAGEENWFFKLSEFQDRLLAYYKDHPDFIRPETRRNEVISFVKGGLQDLSISRSTFDWGIPLPFDEGHVCYVWADALLAYLTGIGYADESRAAEFDQRWPMQYHFVGKDIIRFHCVIWPAMLMAAEMPLPKTIFGHGFLLAKGEKMSKSKGNAVQPADLVRVFGVDAYRYYFMSDVQFGHDGSISLERMVQVYNNELANTWGNLVNRVFTMTKKYCAGRVPDSSACCAENAAAPLKEIADGLYADYTSAMEVVDFTGATAAVQTLARRVNLFVEESAPWNLAKSSDDAGKLAAVMYAALEAIRLIALYMAPLMPHTSAEVYRRMSLGDITSCDDLFSTAKWGSLPSGNAIEVGDPLFPRLDVDAIDFDL